jgi:hypothetical protein
VFWEPDGLNKWPQLTKTNYDTWSLLMKLKMEARDLLEVVDTSTSTSTTTASLSTRSAALFWRRWCPRWQPSHTPRTRGKQSRRCVSTMIESASPRLRPSAPSTRRSSSRRVSMLRISHSI